MDDFFAVSPPIHRSVAFGYRSMQELEEVFAGRKPGFCYARFSNPTTEQFEDVMATLEQGESAVAFSSGMAAIHAVLRAFDIGAKPTILAAQDIYGATHTALVELRDAFGCKVQFTDLTDLATTQQLIATLRPRVLIMETISNPLIKVADLPALAAMIHEVGGLLVVDNTFASPFLFQPLVHGADVVVHSATKFISGHGDVLAGVAVASTAFCERLFEIRKSTGANLGAQDAWLLLRSLRTLAVRMERHNQNACKVAAWLTSQPRVVKVNHLSLATHPQHELAQRLFGGKYFGSLLSFELMGAGQAEVFRFFEKLKICIPVTTLGEVATVVLYPPHASHRGLSPQERELYGIKANLVRVSVGIEDHKDICADLGQALATS
jgi:cystathionine gamma-synthase/methionine-gamma-lyase